MGLGHYQEHTKCCSAAHYNDIPKTLSTTPQLKPQYYQKFRTLALVHIAIYTPPPSYSQPIVLTGAKPVACHTISAITSFMLKQPHKGNRKITPRSYLLHLLLCMLCSFLLHLFDRLIVSMAICFDLFAQLDQQTHLYKLFNPSGSSQRYSRLCFRGIQNQRAHIQLPHYY
jgi:hypothetical protein